MMLLTNSREFLPAGVNQAPATIPKFAFGLYSMAGAKEYCTPEGPAIAGALCSKVVPGVPVKLDFPDHVQIASRATAQVWDRVNSKPKSA